MHIHPSTRFRRRTVEPPPPQRMRLTVRKDGVDAQGYVNIPVRPGDNLDVFYTLDIAFNGMAMQRDIRITLAFAKD